MPPIKLKSRRVLSTQADEARKVAPVTARAIVTACAPPGNSQRLGQHRHHEQPTKPVSANTARSAQPPFWNQNIG
jgi:hypothetical protein